MKRNLLLVASATAMVAFAGCSKTDADLASKPNGVIGTEVLNADNVDPATLNPAAKEYFDNVVTGIYATDALNPESSTEENPFAERLAALEVTLEEEGTTKSFAELSVAEQEAILAKWALIEAHQMSVKLDQDSEQEANIINQNQIVSQAFTKVGIAPATRSINMPKVDPKELFGYVKEGYDELLAAADAQPEEVTRGSILPVVQDEVAAKTFQEGLRRYATRGDLLVSLPNNDKTWMLISNSTKYNNWKVGHTGILNMNFAHSSYSNNTKFAVAANGNGVSDEALSWWYIRSFVMGLRNSTWSWSWRKGLTKSWSNLSASQMASIADYARQYYGVPYCKDASFVIAKLVAPKKFICTTLLWYSIKKTHGIDVSAWWNPFIVTPSDIYNSSYTYVKTELK